MKKILKKMANYLYFVMSNYKEYQARYNREWRKRNKEKRREYHKKHHLFKKYGITKTDYDNLLISQNHCCKICGRHKSEFKRSLAVDHCHKTNKVRGLLCHHCNAAIGHLFESVKIMEAAITYIKEM